MSSQWGAFSTQQEEKRKRTVPDRVLIKRVYQYAKTYRKHIFIGFTTIVLGAITGLASPYMHKLAIDQIIQPRNLSGFIWWIPIFTIVILGNYAFQYVQTYQMRILGERVVAKMRDEIMEKLQVISLRYFSEGEIGAIISRLVNDSNTVRIFLRFGLTSILVDVSSILGTFIIIFALDLRLALLALAILPAALALVWYLGKYSRAAYRKTLITTGGLTARIQEDLAGMKVIQAYAQEDKAGEKFQKTQDENVKSNIRAITIGSSYTPFILTMRLIGTVIILYFGAMFAIQGTITIGTLVAFTEYQFSYFMPLTDIVTMYDQYQSAMAAIERLFDLIDTKVEVVEAPVEKRVILCQ
jgi:ABC-type multidrug transport system fused ATPase/permease subunit